MQWPCNKTASQKNCYRQYVPTDHAQSSNGYVGAYSSKSLSVREPVTLYRASPTPDAAVAGRLDDRDWYADALNRPIVLSKKKHSLLGKAIKKMNGCTAAYAARRADEAGLIHALRKPVALNAIFDKLPESRRRAVAYSLRRFQGRTGELESNSAQTQAAATLLAARAPATLSRDVHCAERLTKPWPDNRIFVLPSVLAWMDTVPEAELETAVAGVEALLGRTRISAADANAVFRALARVDARHLPQTCEQARHLVSAYAWPGNAWAMLLTLLTSLPQPERAEFVRQTVAAMAARGIEHPFAVPTLLAGVPQNERSALAAALADFYKVLDGHHKPRVFEFFHVSKTLPAARRAPYLQALAGCLVAAGNPDHRPDDIAVTALWLYYDYLDHRAPLGDVMEMRLSHTLRAFMKLGDPLVEAPAVVGLARKLAALESVSAVREHAPDILNQAVEILSDVPQDARERCVALVLELSRETVTRHERLDVARLLAAHKPAAWTAIMEACQPLRQAGLSDALVCEGIKTVLRVGTPALAADVCAKFLQGGLARAARRNLARESQIAGALGSAPAWGAGRQEHELIA